MSGPLRVLLADAAPLQRAGLRAVLVGGRTGSPGTEGSAGGGTGSPGGNSQAGGSGSLDRNGSVGGSG
ncbi:hypothetical protein AB0E94_32765, partial [Actinoplanes sp. NPDC026670]